MTMNVNLSTQVPPDLFQPVPHLDMQISDLLALIAGTTGRTECGDELAELSARFEIATSFRQRYLVLLAEVQRLRDQVLGNVVPF
jgi:hypothetical protein